MAPLARWLLAATVALSAALPAQGDDVEIALGALGAQLTAAQADVKSHVRDQLAALQNEQKKALHIEIQVQLQGMGATLQKGFGAQADSQKAYLREQLEAKQNERKAQLREALQAQVQDMKEALQKELNARVEGRKAYLREQLETKENERKAHLRAALQAQIQDMKAALQKELNARVEGQNSYLREQLEAKQNERKAHLRAELQVQVQNLKDTLGDMDERVKSQLDAQRSHLQEQFMAMKTEHKSQFAAIKAALQEKFSEMLKERKPEIDGKKTQFEDGLVARLDGTLERMLHKHLSQNNVMKTQLEDGLMARLNSTLEAMQQKQISQLGRTMTALEGTLMQKLNRERLAAGCASLQAQLTAAAQGQSAKCGEDSALDLALRSANVDCVDFILQSERNATSRTAIASQILNAATTSDVVRQLRASVPEVIEGVVVRAAENGCCRQLTALLDAGVDGNKADKSGETALGAAAEGGHLTCVSALQAHGAQPLSGAKWEMRLRDAARDCQPQKLESLIAAGVNPNSLEGGEDPALTQAAMKGCVPCIKVLLRGGADIEQKGRVDATALIEAAYANQLDSVQALLAAGAEVNAQKPNGHSALIFAQMFGYTDIANALLAKGARNEERRHLGRTALPDAALFGREETSRPALASALVRRNDGKTALDGASTKGVLHLQRGSGRRR